MNLYNAANKKPRRFLFSLAGMLLGISLSAAAFYLAQHYEYIVVLTDEQAYAILDKLNELSAQLFLCRSST